jgi:hypothetical protein
VEKSKSKEETFLKCLSDVTLKFAPYDNLLKRETAFKDIFHSTLDVACELNQKKESTEINFTSIKVRTKVPDSYKKAVNENNELLFDSWIPLVRTFKMMKKQWGSYSNKNARYHVQLNRVMQEISGAIDAPLSYNSPLDRELTKQEEAADQAAGEKQFMNLRKAYPQKFAELYADLKLD